MGEKTMTPRAATNPHFLAESLSPKQIHLVRSTYRVIGEKGVRRLSLQDVADAAEVSKGIVLYYFKTKDSLILATMRWVLYRVAQRIRQAVSPEDSPRAKILAMIDAIFISPEANRRFYLAYLDLLEYAARVDKFGELSSTFQTIVNGLYAEVIRAGVEAGVFRVDDEEDAAAAIRALIDGLFIQWLHEKEWEAAHPRYREMCKRAVLTYLHASPEP